MLKAVTLAAKYKIYIAFFFFLFLLILLFPSLDSSNPFATEYTYTDDIQYRAQLAETTVLEVIEAQEKEEAWKYRRTCDDALSYIQEMNTEAEQEYTTLSADQKRINEAYRAYLKEAANVVTTCYSGEVPDLSKMNEVKAALN